MRWTGSGRPEAYVLSDCRISTTEPRNGRFLKYLQYSDRTDGPLRYQRRAGTVLDWHRARALGDGPQVCFSRGNGKVVLQSSFESIRSVHNLAAILITAQASLRSLEGTIEQIAKVCG